MSAAMSTAPTSTLPKPNKRPPRKRKTIGPVDIPVAALKPGQDTVLNIPGLAGRLACSNRHIGAMMKEGKIPYMKVGRLVRFRWSDVLEALL